jgi:hypothetical protein
VDGFCELGSEYFGYIKAGYFLTGALIGSEE